MTQTPARSRSTWIIRPLFSAVLLACLFLAPKFSFGAAQQQTATQPEDQTSAQKTNQSDAQKPADPSGRASPTEHRPTSIGGELAKETREAEGEGEEENVNLKHSTMVQKLAKLTGLSVHQAHIVALVVNFAIVVLLIFWLGRKFVPAVIRSRNDSIQRALQEARAASEDAGKRLADIENRLKQMDAEIAKMQASAEKEAEGEEARIKQVAQDELGKVVLAAEQEIAAAAKQVRRELSTHTADLALALARKQINVDLNTDQVLVRNFASTLATEPKNSGGKDGR